jgi:uncharacterized protein (TIGR00290 family)
MIPEKGESGRAYGLNPAFIAAQSQAIGLPVIQREATWDTYEREFKSAVYELKKVGVSGVVFGDVVVQEHKEWVTRICRELGVEPIMPLWGRDTEDVLTEFIDRGFKAIVVRLKIGVLDEKWLGREIDRNFANDLFGLDEVDPCGERGEYHTFVTDGPLFTRRIKILEASKVMRDGYWFLEISKWEIG